jgi:hypothetical protein
LEFGEIIVAMTKCKECGGEISSKAEACPKCGVRLKAKPSGCLVSLFKLIGVLVGAIIGLMVALSFLSNVNRPGPVQELESKCQSFSDSHPIASERADIYSSCVDSGKAALKARGVI